MALQWVACDAATGRILDDLPDVSAQSPLRQTIGQYEQNSLTLPLSTAPGEWLSETIPYAVFVVALDESNMPVWGGPILQRPRTEGDSLTLPVASGEAYFDRRYVSPAVSGTVITTPTYGYYANWDQCALAGDLVTRYAASSIGALPGMPIRVNAATSTQPVRTHIYSDADDKTVYSCLQDLMGILNGPEWTVTWEWQHNPERLTPVITIADRIGVSARAGMTPNALFTMPGCVSSVSLSEDYTAGKGANVITAVGPGQGNSRPSFRQVATAGGGRLAVEYRFNVPSTGQLTVAQIAALQGYANRALTYMGAGAQSITLTADTTTAPVLGTDWNVGDDISYQIGPDENGNDLPAFPGGLSGVARTIGMERSDTTIAPIIWIPNPLLTQGSF